MNNEKSQIEKDMHALATVRDNLTAELKKSKDVNEKVALSTAIIALCDARQRAEHTEFHIMGLFDALDSLEECEHGHRHNHDSEIDEHSN